ncbi:AzlC family ABC transporter permease [Cognatiyoonia sp.]|uniref:AzlC family ABC transporter permease n=1 Tax=Cognatiyoonia sp. TaxID=2211652 RepID=UPI003F6A10C3
MPPTTVKSAYWSGFRDGTPFILMALPFALLFGVVGTEAGLGFGQTFAFSLLVIAGAAQFAALQLMIEDAAIVMVILAAVAVNLRMAMYSASLVPYLGAAPMWQRVLIAYMNFDQTYVASITKYEAVPDLTIAQRVAYFFGVASPIVPTWVGSTVIGIVAGSAIPPEYALDFIVPIMFLAMVGPLLKTKAHVAATVTSVVVALSLASLPSGTGLLIAAACAMVVGVVVETWDARNP